jgi:monoamine oxidase
MEHFGSESPGIGWTQAGEGRWVFGSSDSPTVAIIGGGPAGLFTAYLLNQKLPRANITIFESTCRLGGKIKTDHFADGTPFEAGVAELYEYLGPGGKDPLRILIEEELGLPTINMSGGGVVLGECPLRNLEDVESRHGPETRQQIEAFHKRMTKLMSIDKYAQRWQMDNKHPWANKTFHECIREEVSDTAACAYICAAVHSDLATEPHTCNGLNGIKNVLMDNDEYMQLYHIWGGIEKLPRALAKRIRAEICLDTRVTCLKKGETGYCLTFKSDAEIPHRDFDAVFLAIPNHWLAQIDYDDSLGEAISKMCAHYDLPAHYLRVSMLFSEKWWKDVGMPGEFWMMDMFHGCCAYDESTRWKRDSGHVLSFLIAGGDAQLLCSQNQSDAEIIRCVFDHLPEFMVKDAVATFLEGQVERYIGSINAQPGGWPAAELRGEHQPDPKCPGVFLVGDFLFDSTLNACLISANTATDCLLEYLGVEWEPRTHLQKQLAPDDGATLGHGPRA